VHRLVEVSMKKFFLKGFPARALPKRSPFFTVQISRVRAFSFNHVLDLHLQRIRPPLFLRRRSRPTSLTSLDIGPHLTRPPAAGPNSWVLHTKIIRVSLSLAIRNWRKNRVEHIAGQP